LQDRSPSPCVRQQRAPEQKEDDMETGRLERERKGGIDMSRARQKTWNSWKKEKRQDRHVQCQTEVIQIVCGSSAHLNRKRTT
jgi:hypothetical protein